MKKLAEKAQEKLVQEVDHGYDDGTEENKEMLVQEVDHGYDVGTEESKPLFVKDLAQIQMRGGEETTTKIIAEEEEERMRTNQPTTAPIAPTMAPIELTTASGTINGAYISYSVQHNNILRSHQIVFFGNRGGASLCPRGGGGLDEAREAHGDNVDDDDNNGGIWDN